MTKLPLANWLRTSPLRRLYDNLPAPLKRGYRHTLHAASRHQYRRAAEGAAHTRCVLAPWRDAFRGQRAVLMGNGPSLAGSDWGALRDEFTLGTNRIYLLRGTMGFDPSAYCCVNHLVLRQFHREIRGVEALKVIDWREGHRHLPADQATVFLPESPAHRFHYELPEEGWNAGFTVTFAAMQLAYFLGFSRLVLIGVDHRFQADGPPMREIVARRPDADHFSPDYFAPGARWQLPNLAGSEVSYRLAREAFEGDGREILDASVGGALEVFPKVHLADVLADARSPAPEPRLRERLRLAPS